MAKTLKFKDNQCAIRIFHYENNRVALVLYREKNGKYYDNGVATKNFPDYPLGIDEAFMDENNMPGITIALVSAGIAEYTDKMVFSGHCCYGALKLNLEAIKEYNFEGEESYYDEEDVWEEDVWD